MMEKEWTVYILECGDGTLYTGITDDLDRRLRAHEAGKGAKYTRGRGPLKLRYREIMPDKSAALKRELALKRLRKMEKLAIIDEKERQLQPDLAFCGEGEYTEGEQNRTHGPCREEEQK